MTQPLSESDVVKIPFTITGYYEVNRGDYAWEGDLPDDETILAADQSTFEDGIQSLDDLQAYAIEYTITLGE